MSRLLFITFLCLSFNASAKWYSHSFEIMGTQAKVEFEWSQLNDLSSETKAKELIQQVVSEMSRVDRLMSPFKTNSELSMINRQDSKQAIKISKELFKLLEKANHFSVITHGAFDISFSSVGYLYEYRKNIRPTDEQIQSLKSAINYKNIKLNKENHTVYFSDPRIKIDLGGIAKGHAVDMCIELLQSAGVKNAYVSAGGDSRLIGKKNDRLWYIGVRHPRDENKLLVNLPLEEVSLSTSGDYERFFIEDGVRYHHIIDPNTGESAKYMQSATVLADDSTTADALSTSLFVLGVKKGMELINSLPGVSAIVVDRHGKMFVSKDLSESN